MARTVFLLGAGASREGGGPLMSNFLDVAEQLHRQGLVGGAAPDFQLVLDARNALQAVQAKAHIELFNMETVFGLFEMADILGTLGSLSQDDIGKLGPAMRVVLATTLQQSLVFRPGEGGKIHPPAPYDQFVDLVADIRAADDGEVSVISFNYDLAADYAFHFASVPIDYALPGNPGIDRGLAFCKLHGSVNWATCRKCNGVTPFRLPDFFGRWPWKAPSGGPAPRLRLTVTPQLGVLKHCGVQDCAPEPVIVPPTWNKGRYHGAIEAVWRRAAKEMSEAETLIIIGYSLPSTDQFFQYLFALGCVGRCLIRRVIVIDPDVGAAERIRALIAPVLHGAFQHMQGGVSSHLDFLRRHLAVESRSK